MKMEKTNTLIGLAAGAGLAFPLGAVLSLHWAGAPTDFWTAASAVGTVAAAFATTAAVVVALWQTHRQDAQRHRDAQHRAHIVASMHLLEFRKLRLLLEDSIKRLTTFLSMDPGPESFFSAMPPYEHHVLKLSGDELLALHELNSSSTLMIATAFSAMRTQAAELPALKQRWTMYSPAQRNEIVKRYLSTAEHTLAAMERMQAVFNTIYIDR
jgi:hypothetical protein